MSKILVPFLQHFSHVHIIYYLVKFLFYLIYCEIFSFTFFFFTELRLKPRFTVCNIIFNSCTVFHSMNVLKPFQCRSTFRLLLNFNYHKQHCYQRHIIKSLRNSCLYTQDKFLIWAGWDEELKGEVCCRSQCYSPAFPVPLPGMWQD